MEFYSEIKLFRQHLHEVMENQANQSKLATMGRIVIKKKWYLPRNHCTTQHLCLFALRLPAPGAIRKDRKTGWQGDREKPRWEGEKTSWRLCWCALERGRTAPPPPHTLSPLWAPMTRRLNSHTSAVHFGARVLTTSDIFFKKEPAIFLAVVCGYLSGVLGSPRAHTPLSVAH